MCIRDRFGGEIARDENGEPTGFLYESAIEYVAAHALIFTEEQEKTFLRKYMADAVELGITGVVDVQPYFGKDLGSLDVYTGMESDGELTVRITAAANLLGDLDEALENSKKYCTEKVRAHMLLSLIHISDRDEQTIPGRIVCQNFNGNRRNTRKRNDRNPGGIDEKLCSRYGRYFGCESL